MNKTTQVSIINNDHSRIKWLNTNRIPKLIQALQERENIILNEEKALSIVLWADPSTNKSAAQWIVDCYLRQGLEWKDIACEPFRVRETLINFANLKKNLSDDQKNIYNYKTLTDLLTAVELIMHEIKDNNKLKYTKGYLKGEKKCAIQAQTHVLLDTEKLKIIIPLTKEAAQWWGQGTRWCTSAQNNNQFDRYNTKAPLMIFLFEDNKQKNRKFQLRISKEAINFKDENDKEVSYKNIKNSKIYNDLYYFLFASQFDQSLKYIPKYQKNLSLLQLSISTDINNIIHLPTKFKTQGFFSLLAEQELSTTRLIPEQYLTDSFYQKAFESNPILIKEIPERLIDQSVCEKAVKKKGLILNFIPERFKTKEVCELAVKNNPLALEFVPQLLKTKQICMFAVEQKNCSLAFVPDFLTNLQESFDLREKAINNNLANIQYVKSIYLTSDICKRAVTYDPLLLEFVPEKLKSSEVCMIAINANTKAIKYIPQSIQLENAFVITSLRFDQIDQRLDKLENPSKFKETTYKQQWNLDEFVNKFESIIRLIDLKTKEKAEINKITMKSFIKKLKNLILRFS